MKGRWQRIFWITVGAFLITATLEFGPPLHFAYATTTFNTPDHETLLDNPEEPEIQNFQCVESPTQHAERPSLLQSQEGKVERILSKGNEPTQNMTSVSTPSIEDGKSVNEGGEIVHTYNIKRQTESFGVKEIVNSYMNEIHRISNGTAGICPLQRFKIFPRIPISVQYFKLPKEKADLVAIFMPKITAARKVLEQEVKAMLKIFIEEPAVEGLRFVQYPDLPRKFSIFELDRQTNIVHSYSVDEKNIVPFPWYFNAVDILQDPSKIDKNKFDTEFNVDEHNNITFGKSVEMIGYWTWPYFRCHEKVHNVNGGLIQGNWLISYTVAFRLERSHGLLSFDVDLTHFKINQCDLTEELEGYSHHPTFAFYGTHKCDKKTTTCEFVKGAQPGWFVGKYVCKCKEYHHAYHKKWNNTIPGEYLETKWCMKPISDTPHDSDSSNGTEVKHSFHTISSCQRCSEGCPDCIEKNSCMAVVNYPFRFAILCISIVCSAGGLGLIVGVYQCRKRPIFSASSPIFLCITLFGCSIMYTEMVVLYPALSTQACIAVKWTRHLGFCITYTALYMKLCRVYLTFRVKSAHKIKLTEKHLLHWMSPIMVIMLLYLFAWTISDPPVLEVMKTNDGKRLYQCVYNWWDHVLSVGEIIFLAYGVFICWRIRENHDARFISYSIYNIALVNVVMVTLHLNIIPKSGPDMKYLLAFIRTQMSTTITIALVLGSKVYRAYRGDLPTMKEIANSANGFGHDVLDLDEENMQLKEELQKMAMQMERLKSYAMCKNNPHLKFSSIANATANISSADVDYGNMTTL